MIPLTIHNAILGIAVLMLLIGAIALSLSYRRYSLLVERLKGSDIMFPPLGRIHEYDIPWILASYEYSEETFLLRRIVRARKVSFRTVICCIILIALLSMTACTKDPSIDLPCIGDPLPSFTVRTDSGRTVGTADFSSGTSLIVFFHTGCPDCVRELEFLQPFHLEHADELNEFLLISREQDAESIRAWWDTNGYTMPFSAQKDRKIYEMFSRSGIPYVVLSENGIIKGLWNDVSPFTQEEYDAIMEQR